MFYDEVGAAGRRQAGRGTLQALHSSLFPQPCAHLLW